MTTSQLNIPLFVDMVNPDLCQRLLINGLEFKPPFFWRVLEKGTKLCSYAFDYDKYYKNVDPVNEEFKKTTAILPGFQTGNMLALLPKINLLMRRGEDHSCHFEVRVFLTQNEIISGERLPDVLATAVLIGLHYKYLDAKKCIEILERTKANAHG